LFVRWKAVRGEYYAQLEKRIWEKGKVKTKVIAYLGKDPFGKLMAMLRERKITVAVTTGKNPLATRSLWFMPWSWNAGVLL
jgi:glycosyltransferase A (GT-A) superfamily protein (DUF2064 family)